MLDIPITPPRYGAQCTQCRRVFPESRFEMRFKGRVTLSVRCPECRDPALGMGWTGLTPDQIERRAAHLGLPEERYKGTLAAARLIEGHNTQRKRDAARRREVAATWAFAGRKLDVGINWALQRQRLYPDDVEFMRQYIALARAIKAQMRMDSKIPPRLTPLTAEKTWEDFDRTDGLRKLRMDWYTLIDEYPALRKPPVLLNVAPWPALDSRPLAGYITTVVSEDTPASRPRGRPRLHPLPDPDAPKRPRGWPLGKPRGPRKQKAVL